MLRKLAIGLLALAIVAPAQARDIEPREVRNTRSLRTNQGIVILSLRSQHQVGGKLTVWFEAADETARASAEHIRFERKQGVPMLGTNMVDRRPLAFAVPAGRWRLLAHTVLCEQIPPPGTECTVLGGINSGSYPTGRHDGSSIAFEVRPNELVNAGELFLEFPVGTDIEGTSFRDLYRIGTSMQLKWRALSGDAISQVATPFAGLPSAEIQGVADHERSAISCENDGAKVHSGMSLPFACP